MNLSCLDYNLPYPYNTIEEGRTTFKGLKSLKNSKHFKSYNSLVLICKSHVSTIKYGSSCGFNLVSGYVQIGRAAQHWAQEGDCSEVWLLRVLSKLRTKPGRKLVPAGIGGRFLACF